MNIFITDINPVIAANNLDDKRVNKMLLESCQMISTAMRIGTNDGYFVPIKPETVLDNTLYKIAYENHPCNIWCRDNINHLYWVYIHAQAMAKLYKSTYGRNHNVVRILKAVSYLFDGVDRIYTTPEYFCDCTEYKERDDWDIIRRYQRFMILKWEMRDKNIPTWWNRDLPVFYQKWRNGTWYE